MTNFVNFVELPKIFLITIIHRNSSALTKSIFTHQMNMSRPNISFFNHQSININQKYTLQTRIYHKLQYPFANRYGLHFTSIHTHLNHHITTLLTEFHSQTGPCRFRAIFNQQTQITIAASSANYFSLVITIQQYLSIVETYN